MSAYVQFGAAIPHERVDRRAHGGLDRVDGMIGKRVHASIVLSGVTSRCRARVRRGPYVLPVAKKYREVRAALRDAGWVVVRQRGSHEIWQRDGGRRTVTVGGKDSDTVPAGTLSAMRRTTGLHDLR